MMKSHDLTNFLDLAFHVTSTPTTSVMTAELYPTLLHVIQSNLHPWEYVITVQTDMVHIFLKSGTLITLKKRWSHINLQILRS